ncbi:MAG: glycosyltransferase family 4 protein [Clostridia bacterium]|nr:glycosyltransferase family 4 protein [Clostridia bacterium]
MAKIKVLNVTSDHNIGGAGRCILTFLQHYDSEKFDVTVVVPYGSELISYIEATKTRIIQTAGLENKSYSNQAVKELIKIFRHEKPDVVHTHASFSARIAAKACGIPIVYTRHSVFPNSPKISKGIGKIINGFVNNITSNRIIAVAQAAMDNLTEAGVCDKKITVIKNGVKPIKRFTEQDLENAKQFYGLKSEFVFAMIARVEDIKGHDFFLDAAKSIIKDYDNVKFMICGTGSYLEHIKNRVDAEGLADHVLVTGYIKDVTSVMNVIDVNVNASYGTEATSLSLLEGMSIGTPIIASDYGGNPELVVDGLNGLLFKSKDSLELEKNMRRLLDDSELYKKLSLGAEKLYNEKYTADIYARNIEDVYVSLVRRK